MQSTIEKSQLNSYVGMTVTKVGYRGLDFGLYFGDDLFLKIESPFTSKDIELIKALSRGQSIQSVSEEVGKSTRTVQLKLKDIRLKMSVTNNIGIVTYALKHKIIEL